MAKCFVVSYVFFLCFFLMFDDSLGSFGYVDIELYLVGAFRESYANNVFPGNYKATVLAIWGWKQSVL